MTDTSPAAVERPAYLIRKHGGYYKPNSQGYTGSAILAGRYTLAEAESITHPNGIDGPRDGMTYLHEGSLKDDDWLAYAALSSQLAAANARAEHSEKLLCRLFNASPVFNRDSLYQDMKEEILALRDKPAAVEPTKYDMSIHSNPDAAAWAAFFKATFPDSDEGLMHVWFANAMMAMHDHMRAERDAAVARADRARDNALAEALRVALDYVEGCKVNNLPDLGVASRLPFMDDVLKLGDAALAAIKEPKP